MTRGQTIERGLRQQRAIREKASIHSNPHNSTRPCIYSLSRCKWPLTSPRPSWLWSETGAAVRECLLFTPNITKLFASIDPNWSAIWKQYPVSFPCYTIYKFDFTAPYLQLPLPISYIFHAKWNSSPWRLGTRLRKEALYVWRLAQGRRRWCRTRCFIMTCRITLQWEVFYWGLGTSCRAIEFKVLVSCRKHSTYMIFLCYTDMSINRQQMSVLVATTGVPMRLCKHWMVKSCISWSWQIVTV